MNMGLHDKERTIAKSFSYAFTGIWTVLKEERNMRFHLASSIIVLGASYYFSITRLEWLIIIFAIGGMFSLEMINSAIERAVDLVTVKEHPLAKHAKDMAAGAVLIYAIISVVIGAAIFLPHFLKLFRL